MIKLERCQRPKSFTIQKEQDLTTAFITGTNETPWATSYIKTAVRKQSHYKCAYCETAGRKPQESKGEHLETDHYFCKDLYKYEVVNLDNLLSCCKTCNGKGRKGTLDALDEPIIHPVIHNPKEHLGIEDFCFYGKTNLGRKTVNIFKLADWEEHLVILHKLIIHPKTGYYAQIKNLLSICQSYQQENPKTQETRNKITDRLRRIMQQAIPTAEYSAYIATHLLQYPAYKDIKEILTQENLWSNEFVELEKQVSFCALL